MKKLSNKSMSEVQGGCEVNYTFNGSVSDFSDILGIVQERSEGQFLLLAGLYLDGCITFQ